MSDTKQIGDASEAMILGRLVAKGYNVLLPFGQNQRYDLVIESNGDFLRVQSKTGRFRDGAIRFNTYSAHGHRNKPSKGYLGDIDIYGVYCPDNDSVYILPVEDVPDKSIAFMRVDPPKNNQTKGIRWAEDYKI